MLYGRTNASLPSRFLKEIPSDCSVREGGYSAPKSYGTPMRSKPVQTSFKQASNAYGYTQTAPKAPIVEYSKGDMVLHKAFGRGMVISVMKLGGDSLLEVAFDQLGTKKLMANTASAHMKKL